LHYGGKQLVKEKGCHFLWNAQRDMHKGRSIKEAAAEHRV